VCVLGVCWSVLDVDVLGSVCVCVCVVRAIHYERANLLVLCVMCVLPPDPPYPSPSFGVLLFELFAEITPFADIEGRQAVVFQNVLQVRRRREEEKENTFIPGVCCVLCAVCCVLCAVCCC
jgi:hypothetical protein